MNIPGLCTAGLVLAGWWPAGEANAETEPVGSIHGSGDGIIGSSGSEFRDLSCVCGAGCPGNGGEHENCGRRKGVHSTDARVRELSVGGVWQKERAADTSISRPELARAKMTPAFSVTTMDGNQVSMDELQGKVVLLDFLGHVVRAVP
jgi:hypothetical protein